MNWIYDNSWMISNKFQKVSNPPNSTESPMNPKSKYNEMVLKLDAFYVASIVSYDY